MVSQVSLENMLGMEVTGHFQIKGKFQELLKELIIAYYFTI